MICFGMGAIISDSVLAQFNVLLTDKPTDRLLLEEKDSQ